jgi:hypothetical protein
LLHAQRDTEAPVQRAPGGHIGIFEILQVVMTYFKYNSISTNMIGIIKKYLTSISFWLIFNYVDSLSED